MSVYTAKAFLVFISFSKYILDLALFMNAYLPLLPPVFAMLSSCKFYDKIPKLVDALDASMNGKV